MPDNTRSENRSGVEVYWLSGPSSEIEPFPSPAATLRRIRSSFPSEACAVATQIARSHQGMVVIEASCPGFVAVCQILGQSPAIRFVTLHPAMRCMESVTLPPPAIHC